ncbi:exodeoxyribonuclease III [Neoasaia chiangmaiensis NBRC 101099]|uniref:Exodeoxyribonuclease III n=1 Tax=Neoasaia chiangmaiensis TaxID=320497 RepID=A0A1U9KNS7_9PROT|nr:exodeoxyribonuclease III [Neoasaia chiangmaiensis]AQS87360.1 exodeoxyribonuclease III [Neoasaia chiangmaiensis]GBR42991.1 exodeoxyribonuclease III [Neoasaia chiangmaiensis NBRC 101099]GEN16121.1 exodeoxyribonuclease III [Neoasaia chiangmaiensis]
MRLLTWNINSLRLRLPLLERLVAERQPDVVCLQETKVPDPLFPLDGVKALGFPHVHYAGMKGYNGVAILSRLPFTPLTELPVWCARNDCRHIGARFETPDGPVLLHDFYVPAGGDIPDPAENDKFAHKLDFVDEVTRWFATTPPRRSIVVGDLNIAPLEHDVWSHKQLLKIVSHTPPETTRLQAWMDTGFVDAMRHVVPPSEKLYTWWSYRNRDWLASDRGRRLDHVWLTPDLIDRLNGMTVLKDVRGWESPSDHVPVVIELAI